jgi:hypothetical protein
MRLNREQQTCPAKKSHESKGLQHSRASLAGPYCPICTGNLTGELRDFPSAFRALTKMSYLDAVEIQVAKDHLDVSSTVLVERQEGITAQVLNDRRHQHNEGTGLIRSIKHCFLHAKPMNSLNNLTSTL